MLALQDMLNSAQELAKTHPFLLVLAGTPGLMRTLTNAESTFSERGDDLAMGIGHLDAEGSMDAIRRPLAAFVWRLADKAHISISEDALRHIAEDSHGYPFFLQQWGSALWDYAAGENRAALALDDVMDAGKAAAQERDAFYALRCSELTSKPYLLEAAYAVAKEFLARDKGRGGISFAEAESAIARRLAEKIPDKQTRRLSSSDLLEHLQHAGFCWRQPRHEHLSAGIPSYVVAYAIRHHDALCAS